MIESLAERRRARPRDDADHQLLGPQRSAELGHHPAEHLRLDAEQDDVGVPGGLERSSAAFDVVGRRQRLSPRGARMRADDVGGGDEVALEQPGSIASAITPVPTMPSSDPRRLSSVM